MGRKGYTEPRFYTPPLRELTPETSKGFEVIEFAELLGIELYPWQKWVLIHGLELLPNGEFRVKVVIVEVARQNGKTLLMVVLGLWRMFQFGASRIISAAQSLGDAEDTLDEAFAIAAWNPVLRYFLPDNPRADEEDDAYNGAYRSRANGKPAMELALAPRPEALDLAGKMPIWSLAVTSRKGGRSKSADLALLDELREHLDWEAWNAIVPTSRNRPQSQTWGLSNAGDLRSVVLRSLRESAIKQIDDGTSDASRTAFFSYSAHPDADVLDPDAHAQANPSMGYSNLTADSIMAEAKDAVAGDNEAGFRAECLCQWQDVLTPGKISLKLWESLTDPTSARAPGAEVFVGVDVALDGRWAHVAIASQREDGLWHVEIVASRAGYRWVPAWLAARKGRGWFSGTVGMQVRGSASAALLPLLQEAGIEVAEWQGTDMSASVLGFVTEIKNRGIRHRDQPVLTVSVEGAVEKRRGDIFIWDREKSATDAAPTVAANIAWWMATRHETTVTSAYDDENYDAPAQEFEIDEPQDDEDFDDGGLMFV
ncbi:terminase large subunit [Corynebacterium jeddahense]|uniref:Phage Terminase n=1 Tax=Corynebacterium jeddahense TaxID=1414719 RepID=A0ABY7UI59_9CORY|nr:terminase large subunit [Corynebacterium jeddahense]WCZ37846.1 Phage Terminase [Corynebacterium jeddahense]